MLCFSRTVASAVLSLGCLADGDAGWHRSTDIARLTGVPRTNVARIMHLLRQAGLVKARRGVRGGFILARPAGSISLLDIARAVDPTLDHPQCLLGSQLCSDERSCPAHGIWKEHRVQVLDELADLSLEDVARFTLETDVPRREERTEATH